jgi:sulfonate transport system permease protein
MTSSNLVPSAVLPGPKEVFYGLIEESNNGHLLANIAGSAQRMLIGFALGATIGVLIGGLLGLIAPLRQAFDPVIEVLRPIPPLAWVPIALIWFGVDEASKWFLIALTVSFPVLVSTARGIRSTPVSLIRAARMMDVPNSRLLFQVLLPSAAPDVFTGMRLGWTLGITSLVGAEMIAAPSGLGFMIISGMNAGRFDLVIGGILVLGVLSVSTDRLFEYFLGRRLFKWQGGRESGESQKG